MTKPARLALGLGVCAVAFAATAARTPGLVRLLSGWISFACGMVAVAYHWNRPDVFAKRNGRVGPARTLLVLPYLLAYRLACLSMRITRRDPPVSHVAPGLWVGGRVRPGDLPAEVDTILDLTSEFSAPRAMRQQPGYRSFPVLDGATPPDELAFLSVLDEVVGRPGSLLVHCESGRGRAPTAAALVLLRRGLASNAEEAMQLVRRGRPCAHPTTVDLGFLERMARRMARRIARPGSAGAPEGARSAG